LAVGANKAASKYGDLKARLLFLLLALVVYRLGAHVPVPGIDPVQLEELFKAQQGGILGMFNMFSGGALQRFTIFALGHHALHFRLYYHAAYDGCRADF
jgi:preprotein translocase subunit SecY